MSGLTDLFETMPQKGRLSWIGIRLEKRALLQIVNRAEVTIEDGLVGDHFSARAGATRQVTLIQGEHLDVISSILGKVIQPEDLRRNLVVRGINLLALKNHQFSLGLPGRDDAVVLEMTGLCNPCSRMEEILGPGGFNAMRGHGGITARVIRNGSLSVGDQVVLGAI